jgi:restriction endonuclease S subunit
MKIKELFNICYGRRNFYFKNQKTGNIPYISSQSKNQGVMGYVESDTVYNNIITVARNGSVGTAFYHNYNCIPNDDCLILSALSSLTDREYIYYCCSITQQKDLFAYGRKVTPERLGELEIPSPDEIPEWVYTMEIPSFDDIVESKIQDQVELPPVKQWKDFKYPDIFNLSIGKACGVNEAKKTQGTNQLIGSSSTDNGIVAYTGLSPTEKANTLTIAKDGSVGSCFYHTQPYLATSHVIVAELKNHILTPQIAMFVIPFITQTGKMFNFGRAWGLNRMKESVISLPVTEQGEPDWDLMERYINSLPYSKYL